MKRATVSMSPFRMEENFMEVLLKKVEREK